MDGDDQDQYLEPNLILGTSFKDLMEEHKKYGSLMGMFDEKKVAPSDILKQDFVFVVGEPGQGKSRLLRELSADATARGMNATVLDLRKRIGIQSLDDAIVHMGTNTTFDITKTDNTLVCLDGLDEIPSGKFAETVQMLERYTKDRPGHKVISTSRLHFFAKYESSFSAINATYAMLLPLEREQQVEFLKKNGLSEGDIEVVIQKLRFSDRELIIETPRYLKYFVKWYKETGNTERRISRSDIFGYFVDESLKADDERIPRKVAPLKRRTLEKLALVMETAQTNSITHEEMISFIEGYTSDAKQILFNALNDIEEFYNHGLVKDDGTNIAFDNAELQEYLAACALHRMDNLSKAVFDLAVGKAQRMIHPSWYNALSFVLEMHPELLDQILALQKPDPDQAERPEDPDTHKLVSGVSADLLPNEVRLSIFKRVFDYYIQNDIYINFEVSSRLAFYADKEAEAYVRSIATKLATQHEYKNLVNIAAVVGKMQRIGLFTSEQVTYWQQQLIDYAKTEEATIYLSVLKRSALHALNYFRDPTVISELADLHQDQEELVRRAYETMCDAIDPNSPASIRAFVEGIKRDNSSEARVALLHVTDHAAFAILLQSMVDDEVFLEALLKYESIFHKEDGQFFQNLNRVADDELIAKAKEGVPKIPEVEGGYYLDRSEFTSQLIRTIASHDEGYFHELLSLGLGVDGGRLIFDLQAHLAKIMKPSDVAEWATAVRAQQENMKWHLFRIVPISESVANPNAASIIEAARVELPDVFAEYDDNIRRNGMLPSQDPARKELTACLSAAVEGKQLGPVIKALEIFNHQKGESIFTPEEVNTLWDLCKELALDPYDPAEATLRINPQNSDGSWTYTMSSFIRLFEAIVRFADKTQRDATPYRAKIIALIPFLISHEEVEACLHLLRQLTSAEVDSLLAIYSDPATDRVRYHPINFVQAATTLGVHEAVPLLDKFVDEASFDQYVRVDALEASENLNPDGPRLKEVFERYKDDPQLSDLAKAANALLITKHNDSDAVHWRMDSIKSAATEFVEQYGFGEHTTTPIEHELRSSENAKPLHELTDPAFIDDYLELLAFSFELFGRGDTWHSYAFYIWKIVTEYFTRLKDDLRFEPLEKLERWAAENATLPGINLFKDQLVELRRSYAIAINKPRNFNEALKLANKIQGDDRLAISSPQQLVDLVEKAMRERLIPWIEAEARKVLDETHAQKLIRVQLENALMKEGFSPSDLKACHILREPQGLDDKRPDFLVYHGFIGPVVLEIKLFSNGDLAGTYEDKPSYASLQTYMKQYSAEHAIFLTLDNKLKTDKAYASRMNKIIAAYTKIDGVRVLGARLPDRKDNSQE